MEINVNNLNKLNDLLNRDIKDFESYIYDLLSVFKNMSFYWHDGYTTSFFNRIDDMQEDVNDLFNSLYSLLNSLRVAYSYYNSINYSKDDIGVFGVVKEDDFYDKSYDDEAMLEKKRNIRNKIAYAEDDISYNMDRVEISFVRDSNFSNLDLNKDSNDMVGMQEEMEDELNKCKAKVDSFSSSASNLISDLYSLKNIYNSVNIKKYLIKVDEVNDSINRLNVNFNSAIDYINERRKVYSNIFDDLASEIKSEV